jgi:hypothetical protein
MLPRNALGRRAAVSHSALGMEYNFFRFSRDTDLPVPSRALLAVCAIRNAPEHFVACAICQTRKEKRVCPALAARICAPCCGEQREVTLDCPADCTYLQQARQNEPARGAEELMNEELFRNVSVPPQFRYQFEPLIAGLLFALARLAAAHKTWHDRDVISALTDIARDRERQARSGIIYQEASPSPITDVVRLEVERMIADYRKLEVQKLSAASLKDSDVLLAMVVLVRLAQNNTNGRPRSRRFLDGLLAQFPAAAKDAAQSGPTIVLS